MRMACSLERCSHGSLSELTLCLHVPNEIFLAIVVVIVVVGATIVARMIVCLTAAVIHNHIGENRWRSMRSGGRWSDGRGRYDSCCRIRLLNHGHVIAVRMVAIYS